MNSLSTSPWFMLVGGALLTLAVMGFLWHRHLGRKGAPPNAAWVDVGWAGTLGMLAALYAALGSAPVPRRLLLAGLAGIWSFRLTRHLYRDRVAGGREEDRRYEGLRADWGERAPLYFLFFFLGQGLLNVLLSLPFLLAANNLRPALSAWEAAAAALWLLAVSGESLADRQLTAFKADPANHGLVCKAGMWRFSRHPNYFFEWLTWCAFALLSLAAPWGWIGLISPAIILFLLLKVSGIPPAERQSLKSRGEAYRQYQRETSAFIPWFPKRD
jgi:steroid 5-alpha reductase family enzyme